MKIHLKEKVGESFLILAGIFIWANESLINKEHQIKFPALYYKNFIQANLVGVGDWKMLFKTTGAQPNLALFISKMVPEPRILKFITLGLLLVSVILIYSFMKRYLNEILSITLTSVALFAPLGTPIHTSIFKPAQNISNSFYFAQGLTPILPLFGMAILLRYSAKTETRKDLQKLKFFLIGLAEYSIHPFLFFLFLLTVISKLVFQHLSMGSRFSVKSKIAIQILIAVFVAFFFTTLSLAYSSQSLGTITSQETSFPQRFSITAYLVLPLFFTSMMVALLKVSIYELFSRFTLVFILYITELGFAVLTFTANINLLQFTEFQGFLLIMHIVYYVPVCHIIANKYRFASRDNSQVKLHERLKSFLPRAITSFAAICLLLVTTVVGFKTFGENTLQIPPCSKEFYKRIELTKWRLLSQDSSERRVFLKQLIPSICSKNEVKNLMAVPAMNPTDFELNDPDVQIKGLGFLILNDFNFQSSSILRANVFTNEYLRIKKND